MTVTQGSQISGFNSETSYALTLAFIKNGIEGEVTNVVNVAATVVPQQMIFNSVASQNSIAVSWNIVTSSGLISNYIVYWQNGANAEQSWTLTNTATSYTIPTLTANTDYTVSVAATNAVGTSNKQLSTVRTTDVVPAQPAAPTVAAFTSTSVTLNWSAVSGASSYTIHYNVVGQSALSTVQSSGYVLSGLTADTSYEFRISATNSVSTSA